VSYEYVFVKLFDQTIGPKSPFFLISGPCVIESEKLVLSVAEKLKQITGDLGILLIFKASFDKANRTSLGSYRGPGIDEGLRVLERVKTDFDLKILTDVHEDTPLDEVSSVVDVLQTPAFLCRQTNFIQKVASQKKPVNIKKAQFLAPWDMINVALGLIGAASRDCIQLWTWPAAPWRPSGQP
jgi:2-dehydro-3-deoxyphosphooctonate aldolase (KDO 8-P synthase)